MKKLLILAYDFPPYVSVGGLRPYNWYKYLKEYGVEPIVITRQFDSHYGDERDYISPGGSKETVIEETEAGTILRSPYFPNRANRLLLTHGNKKYSWVRRSISAFYEITQFFWISGPKKQIYYTADDYLKKNKVDAIIATGDPFVLFFYAGKLAEKHDVPWIADYRDPWSQDKNRQRNFLEKCFNHFVESKRTRSVSVVTTVSVFFKKKIETLLPAVPFHILSNGYNPEVIDKMKDVNQGSKQMSIAFAGTIYEWHPWKSVISLFIEWQKQSRHERVAFHFYGTNINEEVNKYIQEISSESVSNIHVYSKISNEELLQKLTAYNAVLLFNDYSIVGTKIYDYLGIRRKIILCYENDSEALELKKKYYPIEEIEGVSNRLQAELIEKTNSGIVVQNKIHLFQVLDGLWNEFEQKGKIACESIDVENHSRKIQVRKLAEIITDLTTDINHQ